MRIMQYLQVLSLLCLWHCWSTHCILYITVTPHVTEITAGLSCHNYEGKIYINECNLFSTICFQQFSSQELLDLRMHHLTLERDAVDLVILSQLCSSLRCGDMTQNTMRWVNTECKKVMSRYTHQGKNSCRELFKRIHGVEKDRLGDLIKHYRLHGLIPRQHGNKNRLPKHSPSFREMEKVMSFVTNYAEEHGILLPGRIPGYKRDDLKLLPSSCTKTSVSACYATVCAADGSRCLAKCTFWSCGGCTSQRFYPSDPCCARKTPPKYKEQPPWQMWRRLHLRPQLSNTWLQQQRRERSTSA